MELYTRMMISGPAAMPGSVVRILENAVREGTRDPGLVQQFAAQGVTVEFTSSADLDRVIAEESALWAGVIRANNVPKTDLKG